MNTFKSLKGFTLIEMLLVLVILAAGFFPLIQLFSSGILASSNASQTMKAIVLSQQKIEQLKNSSYANIANSFEPNGSISSFPICSRSVSVNEISPNLKDIDVIVSWESDGRANSFELKTYIANY